MSFREKFKENLSRLRLWNRSLSPFPQVFIKRNHPRLHQISSFVHVTYATINKEVRCMERFSQELLEVIKVCRIQFPQERLTVFCSLKYSKILVPIRNGHKLTKDTFISKLMMGYQILFLSKFLLFNSTSSLSESRGVKMYDLEVQKHCRKAE